MQYGVGAEARQLPNNSRSEFCSEGQSQLHQSRQCLWFGEWPQSAFPVLIKLSAAHLCLAHKAESPDSGTADLVLVRPIDPATPLDSCRDSRRGSFSNV